MKFTFWQFNSLLWHPWQISFHDLPIQMVISHSEVLVFIRGYSIISSDIPINIPLYHHVDG